MENKSVYTNPPESVLAGERSFTRLELTFDDSVFGPVKTLQYFAALNILPSSFSLEQKQERVVITLVTRVTPRSKRVIEKIRVLPTLLNFRATEVCEDPWESFLI